MNKWKIFLLILFFFLQLSFMPFFLKAGYHINFLLIFCLIIFLNFKNSFQENLIWVISVGLLFDYFSYNFFGLGVLVFLVTGYAIFLLGKKIFREERMFFLEFFGLVFVKLMFDFQLWFYSHYALKFFSKIGSTIHWHQIYHKNYVINVLIFSGLSLAIIFFIDKIKEKKQAKLIIK